jgi:hypothetical protein
LPEAALDVLVQIAEQLSQTNIFAVELSDAKRMVLAKKAPIAVSFIEQQQRNVDYASVGIYVSRTARTLDAVAVRRLQENG